MTFHLRVRQVRRGRPGYSASHYQRVTGTAPEAKTVCGAPPTDIDVGGTHLLRDWVSPERGQMVACADCGAAVQQMRQEASE